MTAALVSSIINHCKAFFFTPLFYETAVRDLAKNLESAFLLDFYGNLLGEKQRRLFTLYYEDDLSLGEISDLEGMTRQGVRDAVKRTERQLEDMEERLGLARRFRQMEQGLRDIRQCAESLEALCVPSGGEKAADLLKELLTIVSSLEEQEEET